MARRNEIAAIYLAGVVQGIALVTFPAIGIIFTSAAHYDLSNAQYGGMFLPQAIMAVAASLLGAGLASRMGGARSLYLFGLMANLLAILLLIVSQFFMHEHSVAYSLLLAATGCLGIGFGLTVPALNTFAATFFPNKVDRALLLLNALLGVGTALAPILFAVFVAVGIWWGLPFLVAALIAVLLLFSLRLPLNQGVPSNDAQVKTSAVGKVPSRFWVFAAFALCYGVCETMNGNWASLYMTKTLGASSAIASLALTCFWGAVTVGRLFFAAIEKWFPARRVCVALPFVVAAAFVVAALLPKNETLLGVATFALAGLGCSALLPLMISFGQKELTVIAASVAGGLIAFYQIGYGLAAFGVGPLQSLADLSFKTIYGGAAFVALAMAALAFLMVQVQAGKIVRPLAATPLGTN